MTPGCNLREKRKEREKEREKMPKKMTSKLCEQSVWQSVQLYGHPTTILHYLLVVTSIVDEGNAA